MKFEIEIPDEDIKLSIGRKVLSAVADLKQDWEFAEYIKTQVKAQWKANADAIMLDVLSDTALIRAQIVAELEKKIRSQLAAAMKSAAP